MVEAKRMDVGAMEEGGLAVFGPKVVKILKIHPGVRESERVIEGITVHGEIIKVTRGTWEGARYLPPGRFDASHFPVVVAEPE